MSKIKVLIIIAFSLLFINNIRLQNKVSSLDKELARSINNASTWENIANSNIDNNNTLELTIQEADRGTVVNTFALDCLFHLYIIFKYTNISFTEKQREDLLGLYDILETNGVIAAVIEAIPEDEYNELRDNLLDMVEKYAVYRNSLKGALEQLQMFVPQQAEQMREVLENTDYDKLTNVVNLAEATGFRPV